MRIKWFAHATFLIEGDGLRIITDPYTPEILGFAPVAESADVVIRSSADDLGHCNAPMIAGNPTVVTATDIMYSESLAKGLRIRGIPAQESLIHKESPGDNAMYSFTLDGITVAHFGDVGNRLTSDQLDALKGSEVLLVPVGGPPTIELEDLWDAISAIRPRIVIPMHYGLPGCKVKMFPITDFVQHVWPQAVTFVNKPFIDLKRENLSADLQVMVLQPTSCDSRSC